MSALTATEVTGRRSDTESEPIRAAFYGRKNRTDIDALHLLGRQYQTCEQTFRGRVVMSRCFYDLPSPVHAAALHAAGLPRREGGWDDLAASLATAEPGYDLIVCDKAERLSRDPFVVLARERMAAQHCVPIAYAVEPWDQTLEVLIAARALTVLIRRRFIASNVLTLRREV